VSPQHDPYGAHHHYGEVAAAPVITEAMSRRASLGSFIGAVVEWYDFLLYGVLAALVFSGQFFPNTDATTGTILSFGTLALGFVFRPLGGAVFGHFGDKLGPKRMLVWTILIMGGATTAIGLLPNYSMIGIWAPILLVLLRAIQGFAVGGEWGGAALMAVSQAPKGKKAFYSSGVQMGYGVGLILANGVVLAVTMAFGDATLKAWAWRLPFILSAILVGVGLWVRAGVADIHHADVAPKALQEGEVTRPPLVEALLRHPGAFFQIIGIRAIEMFSMYVVTTFALSYSTKNLHWESSFFLTLALAIGAISLITIPGFAYLSDRYGRKPIYLTGAVIGGLASFPFFLSLSGGNLIMTAVWGLILVNICHDLAVSVQQPLITELFGAQYQYSGAGLGYQVAAVVVGGFTPMVATWLSDSLGLGWQGVAWYIVLGAVISFITVALMKPKVDDREEISTPQLVAAE
jgi:MFS transporter, MHS family, shikimate and dehydroshikimate transport protein